MTEVLKHQEQIMCLQQGCSFDQRPNIFIVTTKTGGVRDSTCMSLIQSSPLPSAFYPLVHSPLGLSVGKQTFCANRAAAPQR